MSIHTPPWWGEWELTLKTSHNWDISWLSFREIIAGLNRIWLSNFTKWDSSIFFDRNIQSNPRYKAFRESANQSKKVIDSIAIIKWESKLGGIQNIAQQTNLINIDIEKMSSSLIGEGLQEEFKNIWQLSRRLIEYIVWLVDQGDQIGLDVFLQEMNQSDRKRLKTKIETDLKKKWWLIPFLNDFCIFIYTIYRNIYTKTPTSLISDDADMEILLSLFFNRVLPEYFILRLHNEAPLSSYLPGNYLWQMRAFSLPQSKWFQKPEDFVVLPIINLQYLKIKAFSTSKPIIDCLQSWNFLNESSMLSDQIYFTDAQWKLPPIISIKRRVEVWVKNILLDLH